MIEKQGRKKTKAKQNLSYLLQKQHKKDSLDQIL